jgi:hypothetical protein
MKRMMVVAALAASAGCAKSPPPPAEPAVARAPTEAELTADDAAWAARMDGLALRMVGIMSPGTQPTTQPGTRPAP